MRGVVHRAVAVSVAVVVVLGLAAAASASDTYIFGKVLGRVPGKNLANVQIRWAFKCLGDKLGAATYEWNITAFRLQPKPTTSTFIEKGTSKTGSLETTLGPGQYQLRSDPYSCVTERGAGFNRPEVGQTILVPDYCAWNLTGARGRLQLEQGTAVRLAKNGDVVRPGDSLVTPKGGSATLATPAGDATAAILGSSRVEVDAKHCAATGGWKLSLGEGSVTAVAGANADPKAPHVVRTANASASGGIAKWRVDATTAKGKPLTTVRVVSGSVTVTGKGGAVIVRAGFSTTVAGGSKPAKPEHGGNSRISPVGPLPTD